MSTVKTGEIRRREFAVRAESFDAANRTVELAFASEMPVDWGYFREVLLCEPDAVDLQPLSNVGSVLLNHDRDQIVGVPEEVRVDSDRVVRAKCRFADTELGNEVMALVQQGVLRGVSVGYDVLNYEEVKAGQKSVSGSGRIEGPCYVGARWRALEFSFTPVPADASVGVRRSVGGGGGRKEECVGKDNTAPAASGENDPGQRTEPVKTDAQRQNEVVAERERTADIHALRTHGADGEQIAKWIKDGTSLRAALAELSEKRSKDAPPAIQPAGGQRSNVQDGEDENDKRLRYIQHNLNLRAGVKYTKDDPAPQGVETSKRFGLMNACELVLRNAGARQSEIDGLSKSELFQRCVKLSRSAGNASADLANILSNTQNKVLMPSYAAVAATWRLWATVGRLNDYKQATRVWMNDFGTLQKTLENGEIPKSKTGDDKVSIQCDDYTRMIDFSEQAFINDELGALNTLPAKIGREAAQLPSRLLYTLLTSNSGVGPTMPDGNAFFYSGNGNIKTGGGSALDNTNYESALNDAVVAFYGITGRNATGETAQPINVRPGLILVPQAYAKNAAKLSQAVNPYTAENANWYAQLNLQNATEPYLASLGNSARWYLMALAAELSWAEVAFLDGNENPQVETSARFDAYTISTRVKLPVGCTLLDRRGCVMSAGV